MRDIVLGARLAVTGGRSARVRAAMIAVGVGAGVILLLFAAAVPNMIRYGDDRSNGRDYDSVVAKGGPDTLIIASDDTEYHGVPVRGRLVRPEGDGAPAPPGVSRLPGPDQLLVSPALEDLLSTGEGALLKERLGGTVTGTIADAGLRGPRELSYYRGSATITAADATRIDHFGVDGTRSALNPYLLFGLTVAVIVLLLPVGVFVAAAVRFGGEERDRRLAALRLIGADRVMTSRIAAGEALVGAVGGLAVGIAGFFALRPLVERVRFQDLSIFATDIRPSAGLVALVVIGVPVVAVVVSLLALRGVVVEPLGVVRRGADAKRRLWWRLLPMAAGALLLVSVGPDLRSGSFDTATVSAGVFLFLAGVTVVLPWLVDVVVRRLHGGSTAWQLAVGRLRMDGGTGARVVSGVAVAVAGAIALQSVLSVGEQEARFDTGADLSRAQMAVLVPPSDDLTADRLRSDLEATPGVRAVTTSTFLFTNGGRMVRVGDCAALREFAVLNACRDGDAFVTGGPATTTLRVGRRRVPLEAQSVPARAAPDGQYGDGVLATPSALGDLPGSQLSAYISLDRTVDDAVELVRNTMASFGPSANVYEIQSSFETSAYRSVRRGIFAGALAVLLLIGASLLVGGIEQLRERRPVLAALDAVGVPRWTLVRSVLIQTAIPVVLGLVVAIVVGLGLAAVLLEVANRPLDIDWGATAAMTALGAAVVLGVTLLTAPAILRLARPTGLRTE